MLDLYLLNITASHKVELLENLIRLEIRFPQRLCIGDIPYLAWLDHARSLNVDWPADLVNSAISSWIELIDFSCLFELKCLLGEKLSL
jgi:hypothetical protein